MSQCIVSAYIYHKNVYSRVCVTSENTLRQCDLIGVGFVRLLVIVIIQFRDITTCTVYVTASDPEKCFIVDNTLEITSRLHRYPRSPSCSFFPKPQPRASAFRGPPCLLSPHVWLPFAVPDTVCASCIIILPRCIAHLFWMCLWKAKQANDAIYHLNTILSYTYTNVLS